jgi:hypothetical protein
MVQDHILLQDLCTSSTQPRPKNNSKNNLGDTKAALIPSQFCSPRPQCHDLQLLGLAAALELHPRTTGATETPPIGFVKENPKNTETLKSFSLSKGKRTMGV